MPPSYWRTAGDDPRWSQTARHNRQIPQKRKPSLHCNISCSAANFYWQTSWRLFPPSPDPARAESVVSAPPFTALRWHQMILTWMTAPVMASKRRNAGRDIPMGEVAIRLLFKPRKIARLRRLRRRRHAPTTGMMLVSIVSLSGSCHITCQFNPSSATVCSF